MLDLHEMRPERERLRRVAEAEARIHAAVEQKRRTVAEKKAALEAQLKAAEEALDKEKEAAMAMHAEVALEQLQGEGEARGGLVGTWPEVEQAAAAACAADAKLAETRRRAHERVEIERQQLEASGSLYQVYCAATGVRWDDRAAGVEGYVAIGGAARAFELDQPASTDGASQQAMADALWEEIEACLPEGAVTTSTATRTHSEEDVDGECGPGDDDVGFASPEEGEEEG